MDLSHKPLMRMLCAEPLEGRWLLSGTSPPANVPAATPDSGFSMEWESDEEGEEGDEERELSDLPAHVVATFNAEFAGATNPEAEVEVEDGETQYGIEALYNNQKIDVTIDTSGEIVETEYFIPESELPQAVREKVATDKPDMDIDEAARVVTADGEVRYEVSVTNGVTTEEGETVGEVPLDPPAQETPEAPTTPAAPPPPVSIPFAGGNERIPSPEADVAQADTAGAAQEMEAVALVDPPSDAEAASRENVIKKNAAAKAAAGTTIPADERLARALEALAAGAGANVWLPDVAGALVDVLPIDFDAIEQGMQDVLRQFAAVGGKVKSDSALNTGVSRLAMAATLVAAVKMLLNHSKKQSTAPALVFGPAHSSWGWVLGTTNPKRRRVTSRQGEP